MRLEHRGCVACLQKLSVHADREEKEAFRRIHALQWGKVLGFCGEKSAGGSGGGAQALITWS